MADEPRVQELLLEMLESQRTPEEVCAACPELLPEVRKRLQQMRVVEAELLAFLPTATLDSGVDTPASGHPGADLPHVPGYEVQAVLGRGGMGVVYQARHLRLNRLVALKMLLGGAYAGPHERARFQREAEAVAGLRHENIVRVYDVGDHDGRPYFTMELIEGGSLAQHLAGAPQPAGAAAQLVATLAEAVRVAHQGGVVHRDLKPANVLLAADGTAKISDFGLARRLQGGTALTQSGVALGTPSYMAPEQARGQTQAIGPAVDVYALGAILYELLTGRPPFYAETAVATVHQVITQDPVPPSRLNFQVPRDLETICLKCLQKDPARRYATAAALANDLRRFGEGRPIQARPVGWAERSWRWCKQKPTTAALLALVLLTAGGGLWLERQRADRRGRTREAIEAALAQVPALRVQGRWPEAEAVLTQARSRLDEADSADLRRQLAQAEGGLRLAAALERIRLTPAIDGNRFDYRGMAEAYAQAFANAGLDVRGDEETVAVQIRDSALRAQLVMALDHWAYVADALQDRQAMARLLDLARRADPDPGWGDRFRKPALWGNQEALRRLAAEAQELLAKDAPENGPPTPLVTLLAKKLGQEDNQAEPLLRAAQGQHPEDFWLNYALGEALRESKPAAAVGFYRAALATRSTVAAVHFELSMALLRHGEVDEAIRAARKAIQLDPKGRMAHYQLGRCLQASGRLDEAMAEYRRAIQLDPKEWMAHYGLGRCLQASGRLDEAMAEYRRAIQLDPKEWMAHHGLGTCLQASDRLDEAMAEYRRATQLDPRAGLGHEYLAEALLRGGRFAEARTAVRCALELLPAKDSHRPALQEKLKLGERLLALDARLPALLQGKERPAVEEQLELARLCRDYGRPLPAVSLYAAAFAARPALADDLGSGNLYFAACAAVRAAASQGPAKGGPWRAGARRPAPASAGLAAGRSRAEDQAAERGQGGGRVARRLADGLGPGQRP
jgi:serine/threonine-protein kinase